MMGQQLESDVSNETRINNIFREIWEENSHFMSRFNQYLKNTIQDEDNDMFRKQLIVCREKLVNYQKLLIEENNFLLDIGNTNTHPLRVAYALQVLNDPEKDNNFFENIERFYNEVNDSKLYPKAYLAGESIFMLLIPIVSALIIISTIPFLMPLLEIMIIPSIIVGLIFSLRQFSSTKKELQPIFDSINTGSAIGSFFSKNEKKLAIQSNELRLLTDRSDNYVEDDSIDNLSFSRNT